MEYFKKTWEEIWDTRSNHKYDDETLTKIVEEVLTNIGDPNIKDINGKTLLHLVATSDNTFAIEKLIEAGANVNAKEPDHWTALHSAARDEKIQIAEKLIKAGANVNAKSSGDRTPLQLAATNESTHIVEKLIEAGADVNATERGHWTALHFAARNKRVEIIEKLIQAGADIDPQNDDGDTPAHLAARFGYPSTLVKLIELGANTNIRNDYGIRVEDENRYPGIVVVLSEKERIRAEYLKKHQQKAPRKIEKTWEETWGTIDWDHKYDDETLTKLVEEQLANGADPNAAIDGKTILYRVVCKRGCTKALQKLLEAGANPHAPNYHGPVLNAAAASGSVEKVQILLNAMPNTTTEDKNTSLHSALHNIYNDKEYSVQLICRVKSDATGNKQKDTPLHSDLSNIYNADYFKVIELLIQAGADIYRANSEGETAIDILIKGSRHGSTAQDIDDKQKAVPKLIKRFVEIDFKYKKLNAHLYPEQEQKPKTWNETWGKLQWDSGRDKYISDEISCMQVEQMLFCGADINAKNEYGYTILHYAIVQGRIKTVRKLLEAGADPNIRNPNNQTALHTATNNPYCFSEKIIELLINAGADVNAKDNKDNTALLSIVEHKEAIKLVKRLIKEGADVTAKDNEHYYTVLHIVSDPKIAQLLINAGADLNAKTRYQEKTPLHLAAHSCSIDLIKVLVKAGADTWATDYFGNLPISTVDEDSNKRKAAQEILSNAMKKQAIERQTKRKKVQRTVAKRKINNQALDTQKQLVK